MSEDNAVVNALLDYAERCSVSPTCVTFYKGKPTTVQRGSTRIWLANESTTTALLYGELRDLAMESLERIPAWKRVSGLGESTLWSKTTV